MKLLSILAVFLLIIPVVYSWGWDTHVWVCKQIYSSNKDLRKVLDEDEFLRGCLAPDKEYKDTRYHHCYVAKECKRINVTQTDPGGLPYFVDLKACVEDEYFDCPAQEKFNEALNNATKSNFSFYAGVAAHYFTDSYVPVHQVMGEDYWSCHLPFEEKIDKKVERNERFWTVTQNCEVYFPCHKIKNSNRKCPDGYYANITYSYKNIVDLAEKTDASISERFGLSKGDYSYLLKSKPTGWFLLLDKISEFLSRLFNS